MASSSSLDYLFSLFDKYGQEPYIGEAVSQLQHAQQAAMLAEKEGFDKHVVIGSCRSAKSSALRDSFCQKWGLISSGFQSKDAKILQLLRCRAS